MKNKEETRGKRKEEKMKRRKKDTQTRNKKKRKGRERKKKEKWENGRIESTTGQVLKLELCRVMSRNRPIEGLYVQESILP